MSTKHEAAEVCMHFDRSAAAINAFGRSTGSDKNVILIAACAGNGC